MSNPEASQPDERQVVSQPDQPSGGSTDSSTTNLDRLRQFRSEDYEAARILAIRKDLHPRWLNMFRANPATRPALLAALNQQFTALTGQERYWPPEWIRETLTIGGKTKKQLIGELEQKGFRIDSSAAYLVNSSEFTVSEQLEQIDLVRLTVKALFSYRPFGYDWAPIKEIYERAAELGLAVCPPAVGPEYGLKY